MKRMRRKCKTLLLAVLLLITGVIIGEVNVSAAEKEITIDSISAPLNLRRKATVRPQR